VLYDPISHLPLAGNIVPASRIDPIATQLLSYIPLPNLPGGVQNYQITTAVPLNTSDFSAKLNHTLNDKNRFSLSFAMQSRNGRQAQLYGFEDKLDGFGWQSEAGWTHNFGPRAINAFHWAFSRNRSNYVPHFAYGPNVAAAMGIQGTSPDPINYGPPNLSFTNFGNMTDGTPLVKRDQASALRDAVTVVRGLHSVTFGGEYRRVQSNPTTDTYGRGSYVFTGLLTSGFDNNERLLPNTGFDFADFLFGFPNQAKVRYGSSANYFRSSASSAYVVDDWKVRSNLSLNLGLRYEYFAPYTEKYDRMSNLDLAPGVTGAAVVTPGQSGPYTGTFPRALIDGDPKNLSPRAGHCLAPHPQETHRPARGIQHLLQRLRLRGIAGPSGVPAAICPQQLDPCQPGLCAAPGHRFHECQHQVDRQQFCHRPVLQGRLRADLEFRLRAESQQRPWALELSYMGTKGTRLDVERAPNRALPGSPLTAEDRR
jgi:hypothetical protein